ncbi:hypothetical protein [Cupriavidus sp. CP313]
MSGKCTCPVCGQGARWKPMVNGRVCLTCTAPGCGIQLFARSDDADEKIRDRFILGDGAAQRNERNVTGEPPERNELPQGGLMAWEA